MRPQIPIAVAAAILTAGPVWALAGKHPITSRASDTLLLTCNQQTRAWNDLHRGAVDQYLPPGFSVLVGWVLPNSIRIKPVTHKAARDVSALRPYAFAVVQSQLVIANPSDRIIAEVILRPGSC